MDCDDALLLLARPAHDQQQQLEEHLAGCADCRELRDGGDGDGDAADGAGATGAAPAPVVRTDEAGALIGRAIGSYTVTKVIGSGGMGVVYLAVHPEIGSRVAIKVFSRDWSKHPRLVARFFAEARATSVIAHENIVNVLDVGRLEDGRPYLMMEYLAGRPLAALIGSRELTDEVTQRLIVRVLGALAAAHAHGIVHRDLKPDNIFVSPELSPTLLDFGIAKLRPDLTAGMTETVSGVVLGTPQYMSPEQARGDPVDERADLYAIGVILYECLLGRRPFAAASTYLLLEQQVHRPPIPPRRIRPELGADLEQVVLTALAKDPEDRYASAHALQAALAACRVATDRGAFAVAEGAWTVETVSLGPKSGQRARRASSRRVAIGAVVGAVAVVGSLIAWRVASREPEPELAVRVDTVDAGADPSLARDAALALAPVAVPRDASITLDASTVADGPSPPRVDAGVAAQPRVATPAPRGTAPLALLASSDALARAKQADVVLVRVIVRAPTPEGLIDRSSGGSVTFDFLSPSRLEGPSDRCVLRVIHGAAAQPQLEWLTTNQCRKLHPLPTPKCSLAQVLAAAASAKRVPPGPATMVTLRMSIAASHRRPLWKIVVGKIEYDVEYDVAPC